MNAIGTSSRGHTRAQLEDTPVPIRLKLSALWASLMFLYVYVDVLAFFKPGTITDILDGRVWEFEISQPWALGALMLMTVPALMVFLPLALPAGVARWINVIVGSLYVPVSLGNVLGESWWAFYWFGAAVETALLLVIVRSAWAWPRAAESRPEFADARIAVAQR